MILLHDASTLDDDPCCRRIPQALRLLQRVSRDYEKVRDRPGPDHPEILQAQQARVDRRRAAERVEDAEDPGLQPQSVELLLLQVTHQVGAESDRNTGALAAELAPERIRVVPICPGPTDTPMRWSATPDFDPGVVTEVANIAATVEYVVGLERGTTVDTIVVQRGTYD